MTNDDDEKDKADPVEDVRKGLGLLFRAAKGAIKSLPTRNAEELVVTGAKEVGRAFENVASTIEKHVLRKDASAAADEAKADEASAEDEAKADKPEPKPKTETDAATETKDEPPPRGPRVDV